MLYLGGCTKITDLALEHISHSMKYLRSINLGNCNITDTGLSYLSTVTYLGILDLCAVNKITDEGLRHVAKLRYLYSFTLSESLDITTEGVRLLQDLPELQMINISGCPKVQSGEIKFKRTTRVRLPTIKPIAAPKGNKHPRRAANNVNNDNNNNNEDNENNIV